MSTTTTAPAATGIQWAAVITAPSGTTVYEPSANRAGASIEVRAINKMRPGTARLAFREVTAGDWTELRGGADEYGVRYQWADGNHETQPADNRVTAEREARHHNYSPVAKPSIAIVVGRTLTAGVWHLSD